MPGDLILVAGASGALGSVIVRRLLAAGYRVRALSRDAKKLEPLAAVGAEAFPADMLDRAAMDRACHGVSQVATTANNILGKGAQSPNRIDEPMYRTFGAAAKSAGIARWVHVSARDITADSPVDYFRVKVRIDDIVRGSGVSWVIVKPSAFMDVWTGVFFGNAEKPVPVATVFGRGNRVVNYIAIDDVASYLNAILNDQTARNEVIDIGGPSEVTQVQFAATIQRAMGVPEKQRHVPAPVLGVVRIAVRPFSEVVARFASLGWWSSLTDRRFPEWRAPSSRFGVDPITVEQFAQRFANARR